MNKDKKRIDNPLDTVRKRQILHSCNTLHDFLNLLGICITPGINELVTDENAQIKADGSYYGEIDGIKTIFNPEDESTRVGSKELRKSYKYHKTLSDAFRGYNIYSAITTPEPISKCTRSISVEGNLNYAPDVKSYTSHFDGAKILNTLEEQIMVHGYIISDVDAMKIVMLPLMFEEGQDVILDKSCKLLKHAKLKNPEFKYELIMQKQCIIHKFARDFDHIEELEGVIDLKVAKENIQTPDNWEIQALFSSGVVEGRAEGIAEGEVNGKLAMALRFKEEVGMDEACRISGFSREEIEEYEKRNR